MTSSLESNAKGIAPSALPAPPQRDSSGVTRVRVSDVGILTLGVEELVLDPDPPEVGRAVGLMSGGRLAFRRVLGVNGKELRLRADVAPFEDRWDGEIVGCVRPRLVDRVAAIDPERFTRANWTGALAIAHAMSMKRRVKKSIHAELTTRSLTLADWPNVRQFWKEACGNILHVSAHPNQHVIGLFDGDQLVGANIHLVFGPVSYSAFTLVDRRYRGTGGGVKMIKHALQVARENRLESIYVHINVRNLPSVRAYKRAGFEEKGWWADAADPMESAERQWRILEIDLTKPARV
ncbi:MAG: Acetyltransferase family [Labilithrix sp.]|nr:Acetyltransferase family [Labilithrix sp.]